MDLCPVQSETAQMGFFDVIWMSSMKALDPGGIDATNGSWPFVFSMLVVTIGGIFIVSSLIGILTSGLQQSLAELRRGRSYVLEKNHTVILGGSERVFDIIDELLIANENQKRAAICVLTEIDKLEMEDQIRARVRRNGQTRIICRNGNPIDIADIDIVNPQTARSIIVLPAPKSQDPDLHVIKTVLALINDPNRSSRPYHIVTAINNRKNLDVIGMIGNGDVHALFVGDFVARIISQTARQPGLSVIYEELLSFEGNEIYIENLAALNGRTFAEAVMSFENSCVIGIRHKNGSIRLNPQRDVRFASGDKVIVISEDDGLLNFSNPKCDLINRNAIRRGPNKQQIKPERILILGWNRFGKILINELCTYVVPNSQIMVAAQKIESLSARELQEKDSDKIEISFKEGDTTDCGFLTELDIPSYNSVIVLPYLDSLGSQEADAKTLLTLLNLRKIVKSHDQSLSIVSEMMDALNRKIATVTQADDFIVGDKLISKLLAQVSENKELIHIFAELFSSKGSEIYLRPVENYVELNVPLSFYTIVESALSQNEIAIGYRIFAASKDPLRSFGIKINPSKSELVKYSKGDRIVVLAEN